MEHALTTYRKSRGLTLDAFGALIGATAGMVCKWELGAGMPRRQFIEKIYEVTNGEITANDFFLPQIGQDASAVAEAAAE